jgi:hemerythrin-like domain-containing protein
MYSFRHLLIDLDYKVDFSEPIPKMIERLKHEHRDFESNLLQIEEKSRTNSKQAIERLSDLGKSILRHAVEEEARIMRVIMQKAEDQSEQSIKVMQEHRQIIEFLDKTISQLKNFSQEESAKKIKKFVEDSIKHFSEEEKIVFPLALKADSM